MFVKTPRTLVAASATLALCAGITLGCKKDDDGAAAKAPAAASTTTGMGVKDLQMQLRGAPARADRVVAALNDLQTNPDVQSSFTNYSTTLAEVEAAGAHARQLSANMQADASAYIANWEAQTAAASSPELRAAGEARRSSVRQNFEKVRALSDDARDAYRPVLADLQGIRTALANDLTPAGVESLKPVIDKAKANTLALKDKLTALNTELDRVAADFATAKPVTPAPAN